MNVRLGTAHLSDKEFVVAFEDCRITGDSFHHADHVRLAWLYVREFGEIGAQEKFLAGIRKLAAHLGAAQKFHCTTTVAWLRLVAAAQREDSRTALFGDWVVKHHSLLDKEFLLAHYSKECLDSAEARNGWVEPDLRPLP
jgi:hypothetical protein